MYKQLTGGLLNLELTLIRLIVEASLEFWRFLLLVFFHVFHVKPEREGLGDEKNIELGVGCFGADGGYGV